jgi:hypothetical protein
MLCVKNHCWFEKLGFYVTVKRPVLERSAFNPRKIAFARLQLAENSTQWGVMMIVWQPL